MEEDYNPLKWSFSGMNNSIVESLDLGLHGLDNNHDQDNVGTAIQNPDSIVNTTAVEGFKPRRLFILLWFYD